MKERTDHQVDWLAASLLFLPWVLASAAAPFAELSWWISWLGSIAIFAWVWSGRTGGFDPSTPLQLRILHPLFLMQGIYAGYGFVSAIFTWLDLHGVGLALGTTVYNAVRLETAAEVQRCYVLAHASLALGLLLGSRSLQGRGARFSWLGSRAGLLITISVVASVAALFFRLVPGLDQFAGVLSTLGLVAMATSFGPSLAPAGRLWLPISTILNAVLLVLAAASGWKEQSLVMVILIGLATFAYYPKITLAAEAITIGVGLIALPVISSKIRETAWAGEMSSMEGLKSGLHALSSSTSEDLLASTWTFAAYRMSESSMFMDYIESDKKGVPREGLTILWQALLAPVPRILWNDKPNLEKQVMRRAYAHGVISELSSVSAKPQLVVHGYLMGGNLGIMLTLTLLGAFSSRAFAFCQNRFGGVVLGGMFFNGLFSILWRGNAAETLAATLIAGLLVALAFDLLLRTYGWTTQIQGSTRPQRVRRGESAARFSVKGSQSPLGNDELS